MRQPIAADATPPAVDTSGSWALRVLAIAAIGIAAIAAMMLAVPPIRQPHAYHGFADAHPWLGIPHAQNVLSNLPFVFVGIAGLRWLQRWDAAVDQELQPAYATLFLGLTATAFGSMYYHWAPSSEALFWDRLPIAVSFMGLFAAVLGERIGPKIGREALAPLIVFGAASVIFWRFNDDLRPYAIAQFFPLIAILLLLALFPARFTGGGALLVAIGCYVGAKALEEFDKPIHAALGEMLQRVA
ncbi:MAG: hypothetical protein ABL907_14070, partial [Hyphomicrobium sp.]